MITTSINLFEVEHIAASHPDRGDNWSGDNWIDFTFMTPNGKAEVTAHLGDRVSAYGADRFRAAVEAFNRALGKREELLLEERGS